MIQSGGNLRLGKEMEWTPGGTSSDIEDRRDDSGGGGGGGMFGGFGAPHLGIGGLLIVGVLSLVFHQNFFAFFGGGGGGVAPSSQVGTPGQLGGPGYAGAPDRARDKAEQPEVEFISFVLDDVQKNWDQTLPLEAKRPYHHAPLVLFRNSYSSACGQADAATGPFYCPEDEKVYLDLEFFSELKSRFGAPGQFAEAYVVAHEIGHHVQKLIGIEPKVRQLQEQRPGQANQLSVRLELQADCFAGVWGHSTEQRRIINESDVESGLKAAAAVGDDRLQRMTTGHVSPEKFTHGTSAQRVAWFKQGLAQGDIRACQTFKSDMPQAGSDQQQSTN